MKISNIYLQNFKRFSELRIGDIPKENKLVLIIGSNGSGKSCLFDAFSCIGKKEIIETQTELDYYRKKKDVRFSIDIRTYGDNGILIVDKKDKEIADRIDVAQKFIGRSSIRIVPKISMNANPNLIETDSDKPTSYIENDERFINDVFQYTQTINKALREPVFSGEQVDTRQIFLDFIEPFNTSLKNIFGENPSTNIRIAQFEDATPQSPPKLIFQKGGSLINYDLLSHGEKQVVILLLNFIVRQKFYEDAIIYIDEMDAHLHTQLQYRTLKEICDRWIPENSQLWTASHALGFIDFANDYERGVVLDFDDLDFDVPQTISPSPKNRYEIFDLAVSREFLEKSFSNRTIVFAENTDTPIYNDLSIDNTLFFDGRDKLGCFHMAKALNKLALIDRDYLSDQEITELKQQYSFLRILDYYNIESLYYHPDNMEEYYANLNKPFDKATYINNILKEKNSKALQIASGIAKARDGYPFYKENERAALLKKFKDNTEVITNMLGSQNFEDYYKVFNAKEYGGTIPERQNVNRKQLSTTNWFKQQIINALT